MTLLPSMLLLASILQASAPEQSPVPTCPEIAHIELSQSSEQSTREICISPGILTGIIFDLPVEVELQEELRFMSVLLGRSEISFRPPPDLAPGERLRLTAKLGRGEPRQAVTFFLVAHPGHATHQVEIYHDSRPRESLIQELAEGDAKNQQLQEEAHRLHAEVEQVKRALSRFNGLTGAYLSGALNDSGIRAMRLSMIPSSLSSMGDFSARVTSYRSKQSVALEVSVHNSSPEKWMVTGGSLFDGEGNKLDGLVLSAALTIEPNKDGTVFLEAIAPQEQYQGVYKLKLFEDGPRTFTASQIVFPP